MTASFCYCPNAGGYRHKPTKACRRDTPSAIYPDRYHRVVRQQCGICGAFLPKPRDGERFRACGRCGTEYEV